MSAIQRKIDTLQKQLAELEAAKEREAHESNVLEKVNADLQETLKVNSVSFDAFVRFAYRDIKRVVTKIEKEKGKEEAKPDQAPEGSVKKAGVKKATTKKKAPVKGKKGAKKVAVIKILPGRYTNIPPDTSVVFEIKDKGARPKVVKAYAEEIGVDKFMETCAIKE